MFKGLGARFSLIQPSSNRVQTSFRINWNSSRGWREKNPKVENNRHPRLHIPNKFSTMIFSKIKSHAKDVLYLRFIFSRRVAPLLIVSLLLEQSV